MKDKDYWKDNNIKKPQQIIVCAACVFANDMVLGARHFDKAMRDQCRAMKIAASRPHKQGFIDQFGQFLTREEAMQIVKDNGQPFNLERNGGSDIELYSEGLY